MSGIIEVGRGIQLRWERLDAMNFVVTSSTGYRAVLPECICERIPCLKKTCSDRDHCTARFGARHEIHVEAFAREVAKTYGSAKRAETTLSAQQRHPLRVRNVSSKVWAEIGGAFA